VLRERAAVHPLRPVPLAPEQRSPAAAEVVDTDKLN
jgi:hypothetical protein